MALVWQLTRLVSALEGTLRSSRGSDGEGTIEEADSAPPLSANIASSGTPAPLLPCPAQQYSGNEKDVASRPRYQESFEEREEVSTPTLEALTL